MFNDHWFDRLNKALVRDAPRREVLRAAGALIAGLIIETGSSAEAAKKNRKRKRKPKPKPSCSKGACNRQWKSRRQRRSCEATCERCKRTNTKLCFLEGDPNDPAKIADCCPAGETCCAGKCCSPWSSDDGPVPSKCCGGDCRPETWDCCDGACCSLTSCCGGRCQ